MKELKEISIHKIQSRPWPAGGFDPGDFQHIYRAYLKIREDESVWVVFKEYNDSNSIFYNMESFYKYWEIIDRRVLFEKTGCI